MATQVPRHVAIIMDGNGRWAVRQGLERTAGHRAGRRTAERVVEGAAARGIRWLTLYALSTENLQREPAEVQGILREVQRFLLRAPRWWEQGIEVRIIGDPSRLPGVPWPAGSPPFQGEGAPRLTVTLALAYGGRWEITRACQALARRVQAGTLRPEDITEETVAEELCTRGMPDPDLIIRTGGELRLSNFFLWQGAYAEWWGTSVLWPDFTLAHLDEALAAYALRERRFGRVHQAFDAG